MKLDYLVWHNIIYLGWIDVIERHWKVFRKLLLNFIVWTIITNTNNIVCSIYLRWKQPFKHISTVYQNDTFLSHQLHEIINSFGIFALMVSEQRQESNLLLIISSTNLKRVSKTYAKKKKLWRELHFLLPGLTDMFEACFRIVGKTNHELFYSDVSYI